MTGPAAPLQGALIGSLSGAVYWLGVQIWPSSVAVIVAMSATMSLTGWIRAPLPVMRRDVSIAVLYLLIKYNALMALSAAKLPFATAPNLPLAWIMICGYAASFTLALSVVALSPHDRPAVPAGRLSGAAMAVALTIGFAPAALLGIPGLIGLAAATVAGLCIMTFLKYRRSTRPDEDLDVTQMLAEASFYLGALGSWRFV